MIAVIMTGGKQYKVKEGDVLEIEKLEAEAGRAYDFDRVLLISDGTNVTLGAPFISGAAVRADVLAHFKGDKVLIFKKKRRKQYRRFKGHRQQLLRVRITDIIPDLTHPPEKKAAPPVEKPALAPKPAAPAAKPAAEKPKAAEKHVPAKAAKPAPKAAKPAKAEKPKAEPKKAAAKHGPKAKKRK